MTELNKEGCSAKSFDLDTLTKQIGFLVVVPPCVGFVITNLYLKQFNFSEPLAINPPNYHFTFTGVGFIGFAAFISFLSELGISLIGNFSRRDKLLPFCTGISLLISVILFCWCLIDVDNVFSRTYCSLLLPLLNLWLVSFLKPVWQEYKAFRRQKNTFAKHGLKRKTKKFDTQVAVKIWLIFYIFSLLLYSFFFSHYIYPKIPRQFGGGQPIQVRIFFAKDQADKIKSEEIPICSSDKLLSNKSKPVSLLFDGSKYYLLRLDSTGKHIFLEKAKGIDVKPIPKMDNQEQKMADCP